MTNEERGNLKVPENFPGWYAETFEFSEEAKELMRQQMEPCDPVFGFCEIIDPMTGHEAPDVQSE